MEKPMEKPKNSKKQKRKGKWKWRVPKETAAAATLVDRKLPPKEKVDYVANGKKLNGRGE
jgi:hypothetical protein